jgi:hypothetical protein
LMSDKLELVAVFRFSNSLSDNNDKLKASCKSRTWW